LQRARQGDKLSLDISKRSAAAAKRHNTKDTKTTKKGRKSAKQGHLSSCPFPFFVSFLFFVNFVLSLELGTAHHENLLKKTGLSGVTA